MEIKYKLFPYPVLAYFSDDYVNSVFETIVEPSRAGYDLKLSFTTKLKNAKLQSMIESGAVRFVYHLECAQTGYRKVVETQDKITDFILSYREVCGKLQICPFIVAKQDIPEYTNEAFHEDYQGRSFYIEAGCILAVGKQINADIEKEIDDLSNVPSIFSIIKNLDENETSIIVNTDDQKIWIQLPGSDFEKFSFINRAPALQPVLYSMVITPALVYALNRVQQVNRTQRYDEFERSGWYRSIKKVLSSRFHCDIESEDFDNQNTFVIAQRIINEPMHEALKALMGINPDQNGGDTE